ncbi:hypothetical protein THAOC_19562, partial [Thalassiosira oceanica]
ASVLITRKTRYTPTSAFRAQIALPSAFGCNVDVSSSSSIACSNQGMEDGSRHVEAVFALAAPFDNNTVAPNDTATCAHGVELLTRVKVPNGTRSSPETIPERVVQLEAPGVRNRSSESTRTAEASILHGEADRQPDALVWWAVPDDGVYKIDRKRDVKDDKDNWRAFGFATGGKGIKVATL